MRTIGVVVSEHVAAGLVENNELAGPLHCFPEADRGETSLQELPPDRVAECIRRQAELAAAGRTLDAIGVGIPGIVRNGIVEESPNLPQIKGLNLQALLAAAIPAAPVLTMNDADAVAAGLAATNGLLDKLVRVWTLGWGVGYGRYPRREGIGEAGHCVVSLDPKERYCGCGGEGHLEGIVGHRAMRLRFLDLEPDEVFEAAKQGDARCRAFVKLWHRALAAATASGIHLDGPGRFYLSGANAKFVDSSLLNLFLQEMVKMSTLQGGVFEIVPTGDDTAVLGAGVTAAREFARPVMSGR